MASNRVFSQFPVTDQLNKLATLINTEYALFRTNMATGLKHARTMGDALIKAQELAGKGGWLKWVDENLHMKERQAQKYMRLAFNWDKICHAHRGAGCTELDSLGINRALRLIADESDTSDSPSEEEEPNPPPPPEASRGHHGNGHAGNGASNGHSGNGKKKDAPARDAPKPPTSSQPMVDALGNTVPANLRDAFADTVLATKAAGYEADIELFKSLGNSWAKWPRCAGIMADLKSAATAVRDGIPYAVHQACKGKGCEECRTSGYFPQWRYEEMVHNGDWK